MQTAHFVHGFNVADYGAGTIGKLTPYFREVGFETHVHGHSWPWLMSLQLLTLRARNTSVARELLQHVQPGDVLVGHSNGCAIIDEAMRAWPGEQDFAAIYINPALPRDQPVPAACDWLLVLHAESDVPVVLGGWLRKLSPWSWFDRHPWGAMGRHGYMGDDPRVINWPIDEMAEGVSGDGDAELGHSGIFDEPYLAEFGRSMATVARFRQGVWA